MRLSSRSIRRGDDVVCRDPRQDNESVRGLAEGKSFRLGSLGRHLGGRQHRLVSFARCCSWLVWSALARSAWRSRQGHGHRAGLDKNIIPMEASDLVMDVET